MEHGRQVGLQQVSDIDGEVVVAGIYGKEVLLDCYGCRVDLFDRRSLRKFFNQLVELLGMEKGDLYFWDDVGVPEAEKQTKFETTGTSAVQFILTSNITVHTLDKLARVYVNVFSCKDFPTSDLTEYVQNFFWADKVRVHEVYRR